MQMLLMSAMIKNDEFIAEIIQTRGQGPLLIICYTDQQITDLMSCLTNESSVLGIDRTFKHGEMLCYDWSLIYLSYVTESINY